MERKKSKRNVWVAMVDVVQVDEHGVDVPGSNRTDTYYKDTYEDAVELHDKLLDGLHDDYNERVTGVTISPEPEEITVYSATVD